MPIEIPNTHVIRDPVFAEAEIQKQFQPWIDVGESLLRYAADLLLRSMRSNHESIEDLIVIGTVFRQLIVAADGCLVCLKAGAVQAAMLHSRAEFEASLALQWMLEQDKEHWARQFYVSSLRQMKLWSLQQIPGTPEFAARVEAWKGIPHSPEPTPAQIEHAKADVEAIDRLLATDTYSTINDDFERRSWIGKGAKRRRVEPNWYVPGGVPTIGAMARSLDRTAEYSSLYRYMSYFVHGSLSENHFTVKGAQASIEPVRYLKQFSTAFNGTFMDVVRALEWITREYRNGELPQLIKRYQEDWRPTLANFADVTVNPEPIAF